MKFPIPLNDVLLSSSDAQTIVGEHFHVLNYICVPLYPITLSPAESAKSVSCGLRETSAPLPTSQPAVSGLGSCPCPQRGYDNALVKEAIATSAPAKVLLAEESGQVPMRGLGEGQITSGGHCLRQTSGFRGF